MFVTLRCQQIPHVPSGQRDFGMATINREPSRYGGRNDDSYFPDLSNLLMCPGSAFSSCNLLVVYPSEKHSYRKWTLPHLQTQKATSED